SYSNIISSRYYHLFLPSLRTIITSLLSFFFLLLPPPPRSTLFPYTTLFRSFVKFPETRFWQILGVLIGSLIVSISLYELQLGLRSEEHTSELQSLRHLVCRLLLEKKKYIT